MNPRRQYDGFLSLERGVDSGTKPILLGRNQAAWAVNATFRGGVVTCRPGFRKVPLDFGDEGASGFTALIERFQGEAWQGASAYQHDSGDTVLVCAVGGRLFKIRLNPPHTISEVPVPTESHLPLANKTWMCQAERWLILQDGKGRPLVFDGETARMSNAHVSQPNEVFVGSRMAYFMGRLWVSNGRDYTAGDLVWGIPAKATDAFTEGGERVLTGPPDRSSVLQTTENDYLNEGGYFTVPVYGGEITALTFSANLDTSLGQGDLLVFTRQGVFATNVPYDRTTWKNLAVPLQRVALPGYGAVSQESVVTVNADTFFRSADGIRSLILAQRQFGSWGNTPVSREVARAMEPDDPVLLDWCSAVVFDNRLLCTVAPQRHKRGVIWKGMVALNFDTVSAVGSTSAPAWEGVWTGLSVLQLVKTWVLGVERCFAFCVNGAGQIELWEITKGDSYDNHTEPILWQVETGAYNFGGGVQLKRLMGAWAWVSGLEGRVSFEVKYKPEEHPCWVDWHRWEECAVNEDCSQGDECATLANFQPQFRPRVPLPQPTEACDEATGRSTRLAYDFQVRIQVHGKACLQRFLLAAQPETEAEYGDIPQGRCA